MNLDDAPRPVRIVGLGGSLRHNSASLAALRVALDGASAAGADVELLDVRALDLPLYDPGPARTTPIVRRFREVASRADGMIWSSPLYHGTISGSFKNALDWLQVLADRDPPFLTGMPIGLIAAAAGAQGLQAVNTMEFVVRALRGWTVPFVVPIAGAYEAFAPGGAARDPALVARLTKLANEVVDATRLLSRGRTPSPVPR